MARLHVEQPLLGAGQLRFLCERLLAFRPGRETIRRILIRRRELVGALEDERRRTPRRIHVAGARKLWGADLTLIWVLGFIPVWLLGVVDYHGSRVLAFERMRLWPTAGQVASAFDRVMGAVGAPERLLTDRAPVFTAGAVQQILEVHRVRHVRIRPAHPWTGGRIERLFRTFKETVFGLVWLVSSVGQVDRFAADFVTWYNDRPHSSWQGRTPNEIYFGRAKHIPARLERVRYFDGRLSWYRFG